MGSLLCAGEEPHSANKPALQISQLTPVLWHWNGRLHCRQVICFRKKCETMKMLRDENISWPAVLAAPLSTLGTVGIREAVPVVSPGNAALLYPRVTKDFLQLYIFPLMWWTLHDPEEAAELETWFRNPQCWTNRLTLIPVLPLLRWLLVSTSQTSQPPANLSTAHLSGVRQEQKGSANSGPNYKAASTFGRYLPANVSSSAGLRRSCWAIKFSALKLHTSHCILFKCMT